MGSLSDRRGYTLIELMIAVVLGLVVVLALGRLILTNQRSWEQGRDKTVLQQNVTESLEWMARSIRAAHTLTVVGTNEFRTYNEADSLVHTYQLGSVSGEPRLLQDGVPLTDRPCTRFSCEANPDTTSLTITLELEDHGGNLVAAMTRSTIRNRTFEF
jgi:prepilin-type N-terminal cleavage/methylation domain-containing protein